MTDVRNLAYKTPEVKHAWIESVEPVTAVLRKCFLRLKLKDDPVKALDPVCDQEIDIWKSHLRELFPNLDLPKFKKCTQVKLRIIRSGLKIIVQVDNTPCKSENAQMRSGVFLHA